MAPVSFQPRAPYSPEELEKLYPKELKLLQVQVFLRHGERTPVAVRFDNVGLPKAWPYCHEARLMKSMVLSPKDVSEWNELKWKRRLEIPNESDSPGVGTGPGGEIDGVCLLGQLTDLGRKTTYALGQRLRHLYVDQLGFMPIVVKDASNIYLRATSMPRALESLQQAFCGMYPLDVRTEAFVTPTIMARNPAQENMFSNPGGCPRLKELMRAFSIRTGVHHDSTDDMKYVNERIGKWMPGQKPIAVGSHPALIGVMDTINASLAHGPETKLPSEFYDQRILDTLEKGAVSEWFAGYMENREYRTLGAGTLMGDIVERMVVSAEENQPNIEQSHGAKQSTSVEGDKKAIRYAMHGCHDTTLAAILTTMGAYDEKWPPFTSHLAIELFKDASAPLPTAVGSSFPPSIAESVSTTKSVAAVEPLSTTKSVAAVESSSTAESGPIAQSAAATKSVSTADQVQGTSLVPGSVASALGLSTTSNVDSAILRKPYTSLSAAQQAKLKNHYVRIRYNDQLINVPACAKSGNHHPNDESLCTLEIFKRVVDGFTPKSWDTDCNANLRTEILGTKHVVGERGPETPGRIEEGF